MKLPMLVMLIALAGCEGTRPRASGTPRSPGADAGAADGAVSMDSGEDDAGTSFDAGRVDGSGGERDGGVDRDGGFVDAGPPPDGGVAPPDAGPPAGEVAITFTGCSADFGGDIVVSYNGSIAIGSIRSNVLTSSLQFALNGTGTKQLSTAHRIASGEVVNLVIGSTWTNISTDPDVVTGEAPDPIGGTLVVREYVPSAGRIDVDFVNVTLANTQNGSVCRLNGNARSTRLAP